MNNNYGMRAASRITVGALALLLAFSPLAGFAKENEGGNGKGKNKNVETAATLRIKTEDKNEKGTKVEIESENVVKSTNKQEDRKENKKSDKQIMRVVASSTNDGVSCLKAYGHLIAPGWIKKNGTPTVGVNCWLPFGIGKKFFGGFTNGSSTPDTTAPVISSVNSSPLQTEATVTWLTNENSNSTVFYSTTSASLDVNATATPRVSKSSMTKDHSVKIENLATSTTYYFKVASKDAAGNVSYSDTMSFVTKAPNVVVTYPVISNVATLVGTSTVSVAWKTNEAATSKVYYGTTTIDTNSSLTTFVSDSSLLTNHSLTISGLSTSTPYNFVIESKNAQGNATYSTSFTATTNSGL
jgi:hypothetical protein